MTTTTTPCSWSLTHLSSGELLGQLARLVGEDRQRTADLLAHLAEVDARRLYREAACPSMFVYCTDRLHFSEPAAFKRVRAARLAREFPVIFDLVARGEVHLAALTLLAPHLTSANHAELLAAAVHRTKRAVEELIAARFPAADVPSSVRRLPAARLPPAAPVASAVPSAVSAVSVAPAVPSAVSAVSAVSAAPAPLPGSPVASARDATPPMALVPVPPPAMANAPFPAGVPTPAMSAPSPPPRSDSPAVIAPLSADRFRVQFTATREVRDRLREAQNLLAGHAPANDLNAIIGQALDLLVHDLRRRRFAATARPRGDDAVRRAACDGARGSAHIPNAVRRAVAARDGYQCTFVAADGRRCQARDRLELHHCDPRGRGGAHSVETVTLRCRPHHALATEREYGVAHVAAAVAARRAAARE